MRKIFTIINHRARTRLSISLTEYCVADSYYHLSNNPSNKHQGWANIGNIALGKVLDLSEQSIISIKKKLVIKGLLENNGCLKRTTKKWYDNIILDYDEIYANKSFEELNCFYCNNNISKTSLEVDHYISKKNGGSDDKDNLVLACTDCNKLKKDRNGDEFLKSLGKEIIYPNTKETLVPEDLNTKETLVGELKKVKSEYSRNFSPNTKETLDNNNKDSNKDNNNNISPEKSGAKISGIQLSSIPEKAEKKSKVASLTSEEIIVLEKYRNYIYSGCSAKTKTIVEGIPRAVKLFKTYFNDDAVNKLTEAIEKIAKLDWFNSMRKDNKYIAPPKNFFSGTFIETKLLPLVHNQPKNGKDNKDRYTEEELREAEESNKENLRKWRAKNAEAAKRRGGM